MKENSEKSGTIMAPDQEVKNLILKKYGIPFEEAYGDLFDDWISSELSFDDNDVEVVVERFASKWDLQRLN